MIEIVIRQLLHFIKLLCDQLRNKDANRKLTGGDASPRRFMLVKVRYLNCKYKNIINKSMINWGLQTPSWQCRREDASPPISLRSILFNTVAALGSAWNKEHFKAVKHYCGKCVSCPMMIPKSVESTLDMTYRWCLWLRNSPWSKDFRFRSRKYLMWIAPQSRILTRSMRT